VLMHLLIKGEKDSFSEGVADQDDIAAHCGIGRTHVPRALKPLLSGGLVEESQGRAPGRVRRVKVYSLTRTGSEEAVRLKERASRIEISWCDHDGIAARESCVDALRKINDLLGSMSMPRIPFSLFLTVLKDSVSWNDILWLSSSVKRPETGSIDLPGGWVSVTPPAVPDDFIDRKGEIEKLDILMSSRRVMAVSGEAGVGKRSLLARWLEANRKKALWLERKEGEEATLDSGAPDVLVLLGGEMVDITSTLKKGGEIVISDPRDDDWPDTLRSIPLIGVIDGPVDSSGPGLVTIAGLRKGEFLEKALQLGLSGDLAADYYEASRGAPAALAYLRGLKRTALEGLSSMDRDAAVMSLILGFRSRF